MDPPPRPNQAPEESAAEATRGEVSLENEQDEVARRAAAESDLPEDDGDLLKP